MNENIICKPGAAKTLAVSAAPVRELLNFLIYSGRRELLTERARKQPRLSLPKVPSDDKELKSVLKASRLDKNGKLFFDCGESDQQVAVLLHNRGAQFWIHYFRCGSGLVSLSFFSLIASAESYCLITPETSRLRTNINGSHTICQCCVLMARFPHRKPKNWAIFSLKRLIQV